MEIVTDYSEIEIDHAYAMRQRPYCQRLLKKETKISYLPG